MDRSQVRMSPQKQLHVIFGCRMRPRNATQSEPRIDSLRQSRVDQSVDGVHVDRALMLGIKADAQVKHPCLSQPGEVIGMMFVPTTAGENLASISQFRCDPDAGTQ